MDVGERSTPARAGFKSEQWRNVYWLERKLMLRSGPAGPGRFVSRFAWPSRDVAETKASQSLAAMKQKPDRGEVRYLGAYKE